MEQRLKTIVRYLTPEEAEIARIALEDEGIASYTEGATMAGMFWHLDNAVGGAKLQVAETDAERATAILAKRLPVSVEGEQEESFCPKCGVKLPPGFCVCWSCGASLDDDETLDAHATNSPDANAAATAVQAAEDDEKEDATAAGDAIAWRAFVAAIIGLVFLPVLLHIYSFWTLLKLGFLDHPLSSKGKRYFGAAIFIDVVVLGLAGWMLRLYF
jgi:hypothetical protein